MKHRRHDVLFPPFCLNRGWGRNEPSALIWFLLIIKRNINFKKDADTVHTHRYKYIYAHTFLWLFTIKSLKNKGKQYECQGKRHRNNPGNDSF